MKPMPDADANRRRARLETDRAGPIGCRLVTIKMRFAKALAIMNRRRTLPTGVIRIYINQAKELDAVATVLKIGGLIIPEGRQRRAVFLRSIRAGAAPFFEVS